jgi:hypothetical protein
MPYILQPADFKIVQTVFQSLIEAEWFDRTTANEKACTQLVLVLYKSGMTVEELHAKCVDTAREIFGKSPVARLTRFGEGT